MKKCSDDKPKATLGHRRSHPQKGVLFRDLPHDCPSGDLSWPLYVLQLMVSSFQVEVGQSRKLLEVRELTKIDLFHRMLVVEE